MEPLNFAINLKKNISPRRTGDHEDCLYSRMFFFVAFVFFVVQIMFSR